jgi:hypothetical protein
MIVPGKARACSLAAHASAGLTRVITTAYAIALLTALLSVEIAVFTRMDSALPDAASLPGISSANSGEPIHVREQCTFHSESGAATATAVSIEPARTPVLSEPSPSSTSGSIRDSADVQQADALRCIVENFVDSGMPKLCSKVRAAVAACACGAPWEVAPRSPPAETEESTKGGSPSREAGGLSAPVGHCSQAAFLSLVRIIRMCVEHPTTIDFSDASWVSHRNDSRYEPILPLMDVTTGESRPAPPAGAAHHRCLPWNSTLLVNTTLDATASPAFQPVALHAIDCAFGVMQQLIASHCFKTGGDDSGSCKILPLANLCVTFRTLSDKLLPSESGVGEWQAHDVASQVASSRSLTDFCKIVMWDAKL